LKASAGILLYRRRQGELEVLLAHPGGPYWVKRDLGAWTIPKGEIGGGEDPLAAARREFAEETGVVPGEPAMALAPIRQRGGKVVHAWAIEGDCDADAIVSNRFTLEWPPRSGKTAEFPEIDRAGWFALGEARRRILEAQAPLLDELQRRLGARER
jgi:predicted NUDIX family NTP pyrophosphohydrolase